MCACVVASALALMANLHEVNTKKHTERQPEGEKGSQGGGETAGQTAEADNERVSEVPATAVNYQ